MNFIKFRKLLLTSFSGKSLYLIALIFYLFFSFLRNTTFDPYLGSRVFNIASYIAVLILLFKMLLFDFKQVSEVKKIVSLFLIIIAVIAWRNSNSNLILTVTFFILGARNIKFDSIVKCYFYTILILLISVIFCSLLGIIKDLVFVVHGRAIRYSLGIIYPTDLAAHILYLMLAHAYINFSRLNWHFYAIYLVIIFIVKEVTDARLSVICMIITIPVLIIAKIANKNSFCFDVMKTYWMYIPIFTFSTFVAAYFFDAQNNIYFKFDRLLSGRLGYGHLAMKLYPVTIWGQKIIEHGLGGNSGLHIFHSNNAGYFFIDSSYLRLIMIYGLIVTIIYVLIMMLVSLKGIRNHVYELTAVMLIVTIGCLVEQHLLELSFNPFLLALLANVVHQGGNADEYFKGNVGKNIKNNS